MPGVRILGAITLALVTGNECAANAHRDPPAAKDVTVRPCVAVDSTARSRLMAGQFVGEYSLTMVATSGARKGNSATGSLALDGHAGHASIALDSVGAIAAGNIGSRDPNRPGVLLVRRPNDSSAAGDPMLRFGADANRSDSRPFDSAYLILLVDVSTATGFSGRWRSGVNTTLSSGYFCADRVGSTKQ